MKTMIMTMGFLMLVGSITHATDNRCEKQFHAVLPELHAKLKDNTLGVLLWFDQGETYHDCKYTGEDGFIHYCASLGANPLGYATRTQYAGYTFGCGNLQPNNISPTALYMFENKNTHGFMTGADLLKKTVPHNAVIDDYEPLMNHAQMYQSKILDNDFNRILVKRPKRTSNRAV